MNEGDGIVDSLFTLLPEDDAEPSIGGQSGVFPHLRNYLNLKNTVNAV